MPDPWFSISARGTDAAEVLIFGDIGEDYGSGQSVTARDLVEALRPLAGRPLTVRINSHGGSVADGLAIYNALRAHKAPVTAVIEGLAASIASMIAMAAGHVRMAENAHLMIHAPWHSLSGNAGAFEAAAQNLRRWAGSMAGAYARGRFTREQAAALLADGENHWFTADEALAAGLIDEIVEPQLLAARLSVPARFTPPSYGDGTMPENQSQHSPSGDEAVRAAVLRAESERRQEVRAVFSRFEQHEGIPALRDAAVDDHAVTVAVARERLLTHLGAQAQPIAGGAVVSHEYDSPAMDRDLIEAASDGLLMRGGLKVPNASPMARSLQHRTLADIAELALSRRGVSARGMDRAGLIKAAMTGSDFPLLLSNTAGKSLRQTYAEEAGTHAIWTGEIEVANFKQQTHVAIGEAPALDEVPEAGEYTSGHRTEAAENYAIKTFGRVMGITRQALINDDLAAFVGQPAAFARSARRLEADLVYGRLQSAATMNDGLPLFHADHGNLAASGAALSLDSLAAARAAMRRQKGLDADGLEQHIDPAPRYLIVPVSLETKAEQLLSSLVTPTTASDASTSWMRALTVVADPRLDEISTTAWYLGADPRRVDGIARVYLAGQERPYLEEDSEFIRDVLSIKCRLDYGVAALDWRGLYRNPGA